MMDQPYSLRIWSPWEPAANMHEAQYLRWQATGVEGVRMVTLIGNDNMMMNPY